MRNPLRVLAEVRASSPPSLRTVADVPIMHAGIEYQLSTGPKTFTPEDLRDAVMAANEDASIPSPRLKLGHVDPRFNGPEFDATPAFGKATNLRLSENGMAVYADYVGVPGWLADILPSAYPSRSIEGWNNVESQKGKKWRFVLTACSLLGVQWPGITVLEDLPMYYGDETPSDVIIDPAILAVAASQQPGGDPMKVRASANLDDVRRAFYQEWMDENPDYTWWWIQAVLTDPNELVVEDDESGQLYKLSFSSDDRGAVTFGEPEAVRIDYIPDNRESLKAAASLVAATLAIGRTVEASWPTRAASRPDYRGGAMDPSEVRKQLGLPEDASDEQVNAALLVKAGLVPAEEPVVEAPVAPATNVIPLAPAPAAQEEPAAPAAVAATAALPPGTVLVDEAAWAQVQAGASLAVETAKRQAKMDRERLVAAAVSEGRIPPARKEHWEQYLESDPEGGAQTLAALSPNVIPIEQRGHGHTVETANGAAASLEEEVVASWGSQLFPEIRQQREKDAVAASGAQAHRPRVSSDAHYTRG